jgi:predicted SAM-dependent methyltransferase
MKGIGKRHPLDEQTVKSIHEQMDGPIDGPHNVGLLTPLSTAQREYFAMKSKTVVLYMGDEVGLLLASEEEAALRAMPAGYTIEQLNGLNIGCGARTISPYLIPIDIARAPPSDQASGAHQASTASAMLAMPNDLPFKPDSVDFIVSLHMLEHVENPEEIVTYWLSLVKPGGGVGIVVPDWRYTWDSRNDRAPLSHKWNPTPSLIEGMYDKHWKHLAQLEHLDTYRMKMSFDFVLRKPGAFAPFQPPSVSTVRSGYELNQRGAFISDASYGTNPDKSSMRRLTDSIKRRIRQRFI